MGRRRRTILTIVVAASVGGAAPGGAARSAARAQVPAPAQVQIQPPQSGAAPAPAPPAINPASRPAVARADVAGDLAALAAVLTQPDAKQADREQAAARLVSRDRPDADEILRTVLGGDVRDARLAVARALADDPTPSEAMVEPLADLLWAGAEQRSVALVNAAAQALATYRGSPAALDELVRFAGDGNQSLDARARVARALGRVVEPDSARQLVLLLRVRNPLRAAAAEALAELTGIQHFGADAERWTRWLQENAGAMVTNRDGWRAQMLEARAARFDRLRRRHEVLVDNVDRRMLDQYNEAAVAQRGALLLSFLKSEQPDERRIAAQLVSRAFRSGDPVPEAVRERLVAMVGDSDPDVRLEVAATLSHLNHRPALAAEMTQLAQERDERVKMALVDAIGRIEDPAAAPQLAVLLLNETSPRVITAAANSLAKTGRDLKRTDPALARQVSRKLRDVALNRGAAVDVRVAALEALGALQDPDLLDLADTLLSVGQPDPSVAVRQAALRALGGVDGPDAANGAEIITRTLRAEAREPSVRWAALDSLAQVGNLAEHGALLLEFTQQKNELDESVRKKAWESFQALLPRANPEQLARERMALRAEPARLSVVLEELCRQIEQSPRPQHKVDLANFRVELGEVYVKQELPGKAVPNFRAALDHYFQTGAGENVTTPLILQLVGAYLAAKEYAQAARFGEEMIKRDSGHQDTIGPAIRNEADRLRTKNDRGDALRLIGEALKMNPPLDERFEKDLRQIRQEIEAVQP